MVDKDEGDKGASAPELYENGNTYFKQGKLEKALESYSKATDANPNFSAAWYKKAEASRFMENYDEAMKSIDRAIESDPANLMALDVKGDLLEGMDRIDDAIECYNKINGLAPDFRGNWYSRNRTLRLLLVKKNPEEMIETEPKSADDWIRKGDALFQLGLSGKRECYEKASGLDPHNAEAWRSLSKSTFGMAWDDRSRALEYCDKALAIDPSDDDLWYWKGYVSTKVAFTYKDNHSPSRDVIPSFMRAVKVNPLHRRAWEALGLQYLKRNRYREAADCFDRHLGIIPSDETRIKRQEALMRLGIFDAVTGEKDYGLENAFFKLGIELSQSGKHDKAIVEYDKVLAAHKDDEQVLQRKAGSLLALGRYQEAEETINKAIAFDPKYVNSWKRKGLAFYRLGYGQEALACFDKGVGMGSDDWELCVAKAHVLRNFEKYAEAAVCYEKAENPLDAAACYERDGNEEKEIFCYGKVGYTEEAWYRKSIHHLEVGEYDKAEKAFDHVIEGNLAWKWQEGVSSPLVLKRAEEISQHFEKIVQAEPENGKSWLKKAIAMYSLDRFEDMRLCIRKAIELAPHYENEWKKYETYY